MTKEKNDNNNFKYFIAWQIYVIASPGGYLFSIAANLILAPFQKGSYDKFLIQVNF